MRQQIPARRIRLSEVDQRCRHGGHLEEVPLRDTKRMPQRSQWTSFAPSVKACCTCFSSCCSYFWRSSTVMGASSEVSSSSASQDLLHGLLPIGESSRRADC